MPTFILVDPVSGRGIGSSENSVPEYEPQENEIPCTAEQHADPAQWALVNGTLTRVDAAAPVPMGPAITFKADLWRRCTDEEADQIDVALKAAPARQRRLFEDAQYLDHADAAFAFARAALVSLFGETRAVELLAVS